jgi:hypothetical protein
MKGESQDFDALLAEIRANNEKRAFEPTTAIELGDAAITRLAIESAITSAS